MSTRLAAILLFTAPAWGQLLSNPTFEFDSPATPGPSASSLDLLRAEDSPAMRTNNEIFYGSPRGLEPAPVPAPAATVSVDQLRHPLSRKAANLIRKAQNFIAMGKHDKAIDQLKVALKEPSAVPYAHGLLGGEYLKTNDFPSAIAELEQAVTLLPREVSIRSNLGYALYLTGDLERGEREARQALDLDRNNPKTQLVLNKILAARH